MVPLEWDWLQGADILLQRIFDSDELRFSSRQVYSNTTNPAVCTGDGMAMAARAKAHVANMEFVQFHPTSFYTGHLFPPSALSGILPSANASLGSTAGSMAMRLEDAIAGVRGGPARVGRAPQVKSDPPPPPTLESANVKCPG